MKMGSDKLLLVESDDATRQTIEQRFQQEGYQVVATDCADTALTLFDSLQPDLVICHTAVDGQRGMDVMRILLQCQPEVPLIAVSDQRVKADVLEAIELGASDYVADPAGNLDILAYLAHRFVNAARMAQENQRYREELEHINNDLAASLALLREDQEAGRSVQQKILPSTPMQLEGLTFSYRLVPSLYLSGDFVDYFSVGPGQCLFYIADVCGHGASSAFVTVLLKQLISRLSWGGEHGMTPADALAFLNRELLDSGIGKHLTMVLGVIDLSRQSLIYSIGAHLPLPVLATRRQAVFLEGQGMPVGLFPDARYENHEMELPSSFDLLLFSDGILEIIPKQRLADKEQYLLDVIAKEERTVAALSAALGVGSPNEAPDDIALMSVSRAAAYANR